jgi:DNA-binding HxlR family transcriptional regulator
MLGKTYDSQVCSAARALELVGERWSLLIIRNALFAGATRFGDFLTLGIATNILKSRLDRFVAAGIMERRSNAASPEHFEYVLTDKGRELAPVIVALTEWGDRWAAPGGPPILYVHTVCGGPITLEIELRQLRPGTRSRRARCAAGTRHARRRRGPYVGAGSGRHRLTRRRHRIRGT